MLVVKRVGRGLVAKGYAVLPPTWGLVGGCVIVSCYLIAVQEFVFSTHEMVGQYAAFFL